MKLAKFTCPALLASGKLQVSLSIVCPKWTYLTQVNSLSSHKKSVTWPQDDLQAEKHVCTEANLWAQFQPKKIILLMVWLFHLSATQVRFYCINFCYCREMPHFASHSVSGLENKHPVARPFKSKSIFMVSFNMSMTYLFLNNGSCWKNVSSAASKSRASTQTNGSEASALGGSTEVFSKEKKRTR